MRTALLLAGMLLVQSANQTPADKTAAEKALNAAITRDVHVTLALKDNKQVFRSGEPVNLALTFTVDRAGYGVNLRGVTFEPPIDRIDISPARGVVSWIDRYKKIDYLLAEDSIDVTEHHDLLPGRFVFPLTLNYWYRFDEPGEFTVRVTTRRAHGAGLARELGPPLVTNAVTFRIVTMTDAEERAEAARLEQLIVDDPRHGRQYVDQLAFLTGEAGTRTNVRRRLGPDPRAAASESFYVSRNSAFALGAFEDALGDPQRPITGQLVDDIVRLRLWGELPSLEGQAGGDDERLTQLLRRRRNDHRVALMNILLSNIPARPPAVRRTSVAALEYLWRAVDSEADRALPMSDQVRQLFVAEFAQLDDDQQMRLLDSHVKTPLRDPSLVPAIKALLKRQDSNDRGSALGALLDIAPDDARPMFIAEMLDPVSEVEFDVLRTLKDETLPQLNQPLLSRIQATLTDTVAGGTYRDLGRDTALLARYGSAAILRDVRSLYDDHVAALDDDSRAHLLAYLDRWDSAGTRPLVDAARAGGDEYHRYAVIHSMATVYYTATSHAYFQTVLSNSDPTVADDALFPMREYGDLRARVALEARLTRWTKEWSSRSEQLDKDPALEREAGLQAHLILAVIQGRDWRATAAEAERLKASCLSEICRRLVRD